MGILVELRSLGATDVEERLNAVLRQLAGTPPKTGAAGS